MEMDKLEAMLSSKDPGLRRLGQQICHSERINYYVIFHTWYSPRTGRRYPKFYGLSLYPGKFIEKARYHHKIDLSKTRRVDRGSKQRGKESQEKIEDTSGRGIQAGS